MAGMTYTKLFFSPDLVVSTFGVLKSDWGAPFSAAMAGLGAASTDEASEANVI